jgi:hypothetical protein
MKALVVAATTFTLVGASSDDPSQAHAQCRTKAVEIFRAASPGGNIWKNWEAIEYMRTCMQGAGYLLKDSCFLRECAGAVVSPYCFYLDTPENRKSEFGAETPMKCVLWRP